MLLLLSYDNGFIVIYFRVLMLLLLLLSYDAWIYCHFTVIWVVTCDEWIWVVNCNLEC